MPRLPSPDHLHTIATRLRELQAHHTDQHRAAIHRVARLARAHVESRATALLAEAREQARAAAVTGYPPSLRAIVGIRHLEVPLNRALGHLLSPTEPTGRPLLLAIARHLHFPELAADLAAGQPVEVAVEKAIRDPGDQPDLVVLTPGAALLIENKVRAQQSGDQYTRYAALVERLRAEGRAARATLLAPRLRPTPEGWAASWTHAELAALIVHTAARVDLPPWSRVLCQLVVADLRRADAKRRLRSLQRVLADHEQGRLSRFELARRLAALLPLPKPELPGVIDAPVA